MSLPQKIALVGNPNSGKTSLFNVMTGLRQRVGNFPGVTVDRKAGTLRVGKDRTAELIDLPGTYSLYPNSLDEEIAASILHNREHADHPDLVIYVADVTNLRRSLLACTQVMDLGLPVILVLNMADLLEKQGLSLSPRTLSRHLGVPVLSVSALKSNGVKALHRALEQPVPELTRPFFALPASIRPALENIRETFGIKNDYRAWQALLRPELYPQFEQEKLNALRKEAGLTRPDDLIANEVTVRHDRIGTILDEVEERSESPGARFTDRADKILMHPVWGYVVFVGILALIFQALFAWASVPMDLIDEGFALGGAWLKDVLPDHFLSDLFVDGIWAGLGGIVIFIPQIAFLFLFIALLEDSGYMSRVVFLMDRVMRPFGFSGKSVIPLIGGMACAVPSIMMARTIPNKTERLITIMVTPLMSCSARLPVYTLLIAMFVPEHYVFGFINLQGLVMLAMYFLGFFTALVVAWVMKVALKYKSDGGFFTELPIFRMPRWNNVGMEIYTKSRTFVLEAGKIILIISVVLWFLAEFAPGDSFAQIETRYRAELSNPDLSEAEVSQLETKMNSDKLRASYAGRIGSLIEPVIKPLGFDWKIGISLITSFAAREVFVGTMATIYSVADGEEDPVSLRNRMLRERNPDTGELVYTPAVAISLLIFYAFAMQCMSTLAITRRETNSWMWTFVMLVYMTGLAYVASLVTYQVLS